MLATNLRQSAPVSHVLSALMSSCLGRLAEGSAALFRGAPALRTGNRIDHRFATFVPSLQPYGAPKLVLFRYLLVSCSLYSLQKDTHP